MNKVILIGRLSKDPELRFTQGAEPIAVCKFSVAVDRPYRKNADKEVDFLNCICFSARGETISNCFRKGNRIAITGRIQTGSYTDQQGNKRCTTDIVVEDFEFIENKNESKSNTSVQVSEQNNSYYDVTAEVSDEDLPF